MSAPRTRACTASGGPADRSAFTLIEVLIAIVLMAILASIVVPAAGDSSITQLRGAATMLAGDIDYVQAQAIHTGQTLWIDFQGSKRYQATDPDGGLGGVPVALRHPQGDYPLHNGQFIVDLDDPGPLQGVSILAAAFGGQPRLEIGKYGEPTQGGEVILACERYQVRVTVAPVTGLITIGEPERI